MIERGILMQVDLLGNYEQLEKLGQGGWGVVYKGRNVDTGEIVALKIITRKEDKYRSRFRREIDAVSRLKHPNIVRIIESGVQSDKEYLVMEFIDGIELNRYWRKHKLINKLPEALKIMAQICNAVCFLHDNNIVHRDLKPSNIMIKANSDIKLMDFGLVKDFMESTSLTKTNERLGTVFYISPEYILTREVKKSLDIYALGVIFYGLLAGVRPFTGTDPIQVIMKHVYDEPVPPRKLRPSIPVELEKILLRLLEKDPTVRYGSASEVRKDLLRITEEPDNANGNPEHVNQI